MLLLFTMIGRGRNLDLMSVHMIEYKIYRAKINHNAIPIQGP